MIRKLKVYFGGSFFPPHRGHDQILCHLLGHSEVERVFLVPTFINPLKTQEAGLATKAALKKELVNAWMNSLQQRGVIGFDRLIVDWREVESAKVSYTVDTLALLKDENPNSQWALCVGDDCLPDLGQWRDIEVLMKMLEEFWVFHREIHPALNLVDKIPAHLRGQCVWRYLVPQIMMVSSTQLRELLREGDARQDVLNALLLPEVTRLLVHPSC